MRYFRRRGLSVYNYAMNIAAVIALGLGAAIWLFVSYYVYSLVTQ